MPRPDTGNFNKFLTSLGLALLAAALVVPYLYFKNTETLEVSRRDLRAMTRTGSQALESRQRAIVSLEPWVIGAAGLSAAGGIVLLILGGARLKRAQESEDEEARLRRDRTRLEIRDMSPSERAEALSEKVRAEDERVRVDTEPPPQRGEAQQGKPASLVSPMKTRKEVVARAQAKFGEVFQRDEPSTHRLKLQLSLRSTTDALSVDALFEAEIDQLSDVLVDLQVSNPRVIGKSVRNRTDELIAKVSRYKHMSERQTVGWLVIVIPEELEQEADSKELESVERRLRKAIGDFGSATVVQEKAMDFLPNLFRYEFGAPTL